jgi:hypothetical protein
MSRRFRPSNLLRIGCHSMRERNGWEMNVPDSGFAKGSPERSPSENGRSGTLAGQAFLQTILRMALATR